MWMRKLLLHKAKLRSLEALGLNYWLTSIPWLNLVGSMSTPIMRDAPAAFAPSATWHNCNNTWWSYISLEKIRKRWQSRKTKTQGMYEVNEVWNAIYHTTLVFWGETVAKVEIPRLHNCIHSSWSLVTLYKWLVIEDPYRKANCS